MAESNNQIEIGMNKDIWKELQVIFENQMRSIVEPVKMASEQIAKTINDNFKELHQNVEQYGKTAGRFATIMVELGWPPSEELYVTDVKEVVAAYDEKGAEAISGWVNELVVERFRAKKLNEMTENWSQKKWLANRIPILKQAVNAHVNENYFVSVPALLPQIEGIIAERFKHQGKMDGKVQKEYFVELLSKREIYSYDQAIKTFLFDVILVGFEHGTIPRSLLSRHAILHGADTTYGTVTNSLKSILLFDYLQ